MNDVIEGIVVDETTDAIPVGQFGAFDDLATYHTLVAESGVDPETIPEEAYDIHVLTRVLAKKVVGNTETSWTRDDAAKVMAMLSDDEAGRQHFLFMEQLTKPQTLELTAVPAKETDEATG